VYQQSNEPQGNALNLDHATGIITIDLAAIAGNWLALAQRVAPAECAAVVKADAYGLGAARVVPALAAAGCRTFFVATPDEAAEVRALVPEAMIFVLDGVWAEAAPPLVSVAAIPVVSTLHALAVWDEQARTLERRLPVALQIETGLHRLGLDLTRMPTAAPPRHLDLRLVMSHLACADEPEHPLNEAQRRAFDTARTRLPTVRASLAASDGLMLGAAYHYDLVRPGYALYGGQAFRGGPTPVKPAVTVSARVLQAADVPAGAFIGYGATYTTGSPRRIATIASGYADGLPRNASGDTSGRAGHVAIRGALCPIVGRVSMDLTTIDVTDVPGGPVAPGELAEIVGPHITLEAAGAGAQTIGYEILTRLGRRFARVYVD
jgi:alanine racemase